MFAIKKKLLFSAAILTLGEIVFLSPGHTLPDNGIVRTTNSTFTQPSGNSTNGSLNTETGSLSVEGLSGSISIPPDVLQSISNIDGIGSNEVTRRNSSSQSDALSGEIDGLSSDSSNNITICFSEPCVPSGEGTMAITLNELAELIEQDLQQSLEKVAAAEALEQEVADRPRRFVRRRSTDCISPAIQARETFNRKLQESRQFIEQMKQLDPNNSVW